MQCICKKCQKEYGFIEEVSDKTVCLYDQTERSKREDSQSKIIQRYCYALRSQEDKLIEDMRCSEINNI